VFCACTSFFDLLHFRLLRAPLIASCLWSSGVFSRPKGLLSCLPRICSADRNVQGAS